MILLKFELKKLKSNSGFLKIIVILLFLNGFLFYLNNKQTNFDSEYYKTLHKTIDGIHISEAKKKISNEKEKYNIDDWYLYKDKILTLEKIEEEIDNTCEFRTFREEIKEQYNKTKDISIFKSENNYNEKYIRKTFNAYENLVIKEDVVLIPSVALENLVGFSLVDIIGLVLLLYIAGITIYHERKNGFLMFTQTNLYGKRKQFIYKLYSYWIVGICWTILSFFICFIISTKLYGFIPLSTSIQSIPSLVTSTYSINVGNFIVVYLLVRCFAYILLSTIITLLSYVVDSFVIMVMGTIGGFVLNFVLYNIINEFSILSPLKYINIWQLLRSDEILGRFIIVRILNEPISLLYFTMPLIIILILLILLARKYFKQTKSERANKKIRLLNKKPKTLLYYELKKMWLCENGLLTFVLIIMIHSMIIVNLTPKTNIDDVYYNNFINSIGTSVTEVSEKNLIQKDKEFEEIQRKLAITDNVKEEMLLTDELKSFNAFNKYKEKFYEIKNLNVDKKLLKENEYRLIFEDSNIIKLSELLLFLLIIVIVPSVFQREKETGMEKLQKMTLEGRRKLWGIKIITIMSIIIPACIIIFGSIILKNILYFKEVNFDETITSLSIYFQYNFQMSIKSFLILTSVIRLIIVIAISIIFSFISSKITGRYLNIIVLSIISILPILAMSYVDSPILSGLYHLIFIYSYNNIKSFLLVFSSVILVSIYIYIRGRKI